MAYPGALATFAGFVASHTLAVDSHAAQHNLEQAEIIATQTKIGTGASTPANGLFLAGNGAGTSAWRSILKADVPGIDQVDNTSDATKNAAVATLANKTLTTPTIGSFTNAQHDHTNAAGGGLLASSAFASNAITNATTVFDEIAAGTNSLGTSFADFSGWTGGSLTTSGGNVLFFIEFTYYKVTAGLNLSHFRIVVDSTNGTTFKQYTNETSSHKMISRTMLFTGLSAGVHTIKMQGLSESSGTTNTDSNDFLRITALELKV